MNLLRVYPITKIPSLLLLILSLCCVVMPVSGQTTSPAGLWRTVDDKSGDAKSFVRIWQKNGVFYGRIEKLLRPSADGKPRRCEKCEGENKNAPVLGLKFLWSLKKNGNEWSGGEILDPENGKIYRAKMGLRDNGEKLEVRGYIGFSMFGRSQTWNRIE